MRSNLRVVGLLRWTIAAVFVAAFGCGSSGVPAGAERGACFPNSTCNAGLVCLSSLCVKAATPDGAAGGSGGNNPSGTAGAGGAVGAAGAAATGSDAAAGTGGGGAAGVGGPDGGAGAGAAGTGAAGTSAAGTSGADAAAGAGSDGGPTSDASPDAGAAICGFVMPNSATSGLPNAAMYDTSTADVVVDKVTGLMWQRMNFGQTFSFGPEVVAACSTLTLAGHSDWRLPTVLELVSLLALPGASGTAPPSIDAAAFPNTVHGQFWTSMRAAVTTGTGAPWWVEFTRGTTGYAPLPMYIRCVRSTGTPAARCSSSAARYQVNAGLVTDATTGLTWQQSASPQPLAWADAKTYCSGLAGGFRMPSANKLLTLVDYTKPSPGPTIDTSAFPDTQATPYWTQSFPTAGQLPAPALAVLFKDGSATNSGVAPPYRVRCVR
jgi:Protein of unknown function (DUF1566)